MEHTITVDYTSEDDGIHLSCTCGWEKCVGYDPTIESLVVEKQKHLSTLMLKALGQIDIIQQGMESKYGKDSLEYLREARDGGMYEAN